MASARALVFAALVGSVSAACTTDNNKAVFALYQTYIVGKSSDEIDIHLAGFSTNNRKVKYRVTALPAAGSVFKPTQVYCDYKYQPKANAVALASGDLPHTTTCDSTSLVYKPQANAQLAREGPIAKFSFKTEEYHFDTCSDTAHVYLLNSDRVLSASFFDRTADTWTIVQNGPTSGGAASYDASSRGVLNRYVYGEEEMINLSAKSPGVTTPTSDQTLWYFNAPSKFLGDMAAAYGGTLSFTLGHAAGDFAAVANRVQNAHMVRLLCATCKMVNEDRGIQLSYILPVAWDGATKTFSVSLLESAWKKDPENSNIAWSAAPTNCEMYQVLHRLSGLQIMGDHLNGHESVMLDNVKIAAPASSSNLDGTCYSKMHTVY